MTSEVLPALLCGDSASDLIFTPPSLCTSTRYVGLPLGPRPLSQQGPPPLRLPCSSPWCVPMCARLRFQLPH